MATYDHLSTDVRMMVLGLPIRRPPGRKRALSFREQLNVALAWGERLNALAQRGASERHTALAALMKNLIRLQAAGAPPHKVRQVQTMMNEMGRYVALQIRPPEMGYPTIDREVAAEFGINARMVLRCRTSLRAFLPHPVWIEREHEGRARVDFEAKQLAKRLMTQERLAKREPVEIRFGALWVDAEDSKLCAIPGAAPRGARCVFLATGRELVTDSKARQAAYRQVVAEFDQGILVKRK